VSQEKGPLPRLPSFAKIDALNNLHDDDMYDNLDEEHLREEEEAAAWEAYFEEQGEEYQ